MNWTRVLDDCVIINFFDNSFVLTGSEGMVYFNGSPLLYSGKGYQKSFLKPVNSGKVKRRLMTLEKNAYVLGLDCGPDGRLFWKIWLKSAFKKFRGKPFFCCSFWNDNVLNEKKYYENDLRKPLKVWRDAECGDLVQCLETLV